MHTVTVYTETDAGMPGFQPSEPLFITNAGHAYEKCTCEFVHKRRK